MKKLKLAIYLLTLVFALTGCKKDVHVKTISEIKQMNKSQKQKSQKNKKRVKKSENTKLTGTESSPVPEDETTDNEQENQTVTDKKVIVLDPGHSAVVATGTEPLGPGSSEQKAADASGTRGISSGVPEYELTLNISVQLKEVLEQQMTDTTLIDVDTLRNDFHDLLTDMDADSADFADNFEDYMRNAILNSMLKESYMGRLEEWRKKFYAAMDDGVTEQEYNALKEEGQQIADEMKAQRDAMADMFGWESESTSQSSTSKGFQAMSQDTGEELNGRFTALQIAGEEIKTQNIAQTQSLNLLTARADAILSMNTETRNIADDTRNLIAQSYLELVQISENTGNSAKYLKDIKADIAEVKKNTSKL